MRRWLRGIKRHKENRGKDWQVIESPINITGKLAGLKKKVM